MPTNNYNQIGTRPTQGGDLAFYNNGADIPEGSGVLEDTTIDRGCVLPTAAGGVVATVGVAIEKILAGRWGRVRINGTAVLLADGVVTRGDTVQISDTASKMGRCKTKGAGVVQLGVALNSGADGDPIEVSLAIAKNA